MQNIFPTIVAPSTVVCDNAPTTDVPLSDGAACAPESGRCAAGQRETLTVKYECSTAGYIGDPTTITCDGATTKWTGAAPTCKGMCWEGEYIVN